MTDKRSGYKLLIKQRVLFFMLLPALIWVVLFKYLPMFGLYMSFTDYSPGGKNFMRSFFQRALCRAAVV